MKKYKIKYDQFFNKNNKDLKTSLVSLALFLCLVALITNCSKDESKPNSNNAPPPPVAPISGPSGHPLETDDSNNIRRQNLYFPDNSYWVHVDKEITRECEKRTIRIANNMIEEYYFESNSSLPVLSSVCLIKESRENRDNRSGTASFYWIGRGNHNNGGNGGHHRSGSDLHQSQNTRCFFQEQVRVKTIARELHLTFQNGKSEKYDRISEEKWKKLSQTCSQ